MKIREKEKKENFRSSNFTFNTYKRNEPLLFAIPFHNCIKYSVKKVMVNCLS